MFDTHYDLLTIAYNSYIKNDYSYLEKVSKFFRDNNVRGVIANLYFMSKEEMNEELGPNYYQDSISVYDMFVKAIIVEYDEKEFNGYTFDVRLYEWVQFFKKILKMIFDGRLCRKYQSIKEEDLEEELEELIWEEVQSEIEIVSDWECNISEIKVTETRNRDTICGIVEGDYSFLRYVEEDDDWKKVIEVAEECYRYQESGNVDYCFEMVFNKELSKYNIRLLEKNG